MKKLITFCLLLASTFMVNAQTKKLTKAETVAYLDKVYKLSDGETLNYKFQEEKTYTVGNHSFTYDKITMGWNSGYPSVLSNIKWETCSEVQIIIEPNYSSDILIDVKVVFDLKYKFTHDDLTQFQNEMNLLIIKTKAESFKKAIERLVEIAKEENKDPFEN